MNELVPSRSSHSALSYTVLAVGLAMLICTLFYPFGYDQAAFSVAGEMVRKLGAVPYRDFLDTKPPVIFYLYALATFLFGHHEWSIRLLDLVVQAVAAFYLYKIVRKYLERGTSQISAGLYLILYSSTGFWMTAQAESFAVLPSLALVDCTLRLYDSEKNYWKLGLVAGISLCLLFLLKFTLILGVSPIIVLLLTSKRRPAKGAMSFIIVPMLTFVSGIGVYLFSLYAAGGLDRFFESVAWVSRYSSIDPIFGRTTIALKYYEEFPSRLLTTCSPLLLLLSCVPVVRLLRRSSGRSIESIHFLISLLALTVGFHLFGVLIERKMFPYHYSRMFFAIAPLAAIGLQRATQLFAENWRSVEGRTRGAGLIAKGLLCVAAAALLFYSPLVKLASQSIAWPLLSLSDSHSIHDEVQTRTPEYFAADQYRVAQHLTRTGAKSVFVWGNDVGIYFFASELPTTLCLTATPFRTSWTPPGWQQTLIAQLQRNPPQRFVVEYGDAKSFITGSDEDSFHALLQRHALAGVLAQRYMPDTTIGHFYLYRLKEPR
jgi:hypothetical protein